MTLPYREMTGSLQYIVTCTRPDMANVVRCLGKYNGAFTRENFTMAKRVVRYLVGTKHFGLVYRPIKDTAERILGRRSCDVQEFKSIYHRIRIEFERLHMDVEKQAAETCYDKHVRIGIDSGFRLRGQLGVGAATLERAEDRSRGVHTQL